MAGVCRCCHLTSEENMGTYMYVLNEEIDISNNEVKLPFFMIKNGYSQWKNEYKEWIGNHNNLVIKVI